MTIVFDDLTNGSATYFDDLDAVGIASAIGAGVVDSAAAPTAGVNVGTPTGAGVTDAASGPAGSAAAIVTATGAGVTDAATGPAGSAIGYAFVTLVAPLNTGARSILFAGTFVGTPPAAGDVVRYPTTDGLVVATDGTVIADVNSGVYTLYYNDGTGEVAFTLTLDSNVHAIGTGVTDAATAPISTQYGGVNVSGTGITDAATAPTGSGSSARVATGAGVIDAATGPAGTASGGGTATGAGKTDAATSPDGSASITVTAAGTGVTDSASAPQGSVTAGTTASGSGAVASSAAPTGMARGGLIIGDIPLSVLSIIYPTDVQRLRAA